MFNFFVAMEAGQIMFSNMVFVNKRNIFKFSQFLRLVMAGGKRVGVRGGLMQEALQASKAKTKTMVIVLGLQALIHQYKLAQLRALRGRVALTVDVSKSRKRRPT